MRAADLAAAAVPAAAPADLRLDLVVPAVLLRESVAPLPADLPEWQERAAQQESNHPPSGVNHPGPGSLIGDPGLFYAWFFGR